VAYFQYHDCFRTLHIDLVNNIRLLFGADPYCEVSTEMHRDRYRVHLGCENELVLLTITEDVSVYIHISAVTQLPVLLLVLLPVALPVALPVVILIER
jgi:hypothetical protein